MYYKTKPAGKTDFAEKPSSANCVNRVPGITDDVHLSSYWSSRVIYSFSSVEAEIV